MGRYKEIIIPSFERETSFVEHFKFDDRSMIDVINREGFNPLLFLFFREDLYAAYWYVDSYGFKILDKISKGDIT